MDTKIRETLGVIKRCYDALEDKKAVDIKILKVAGKSSVTDYFVIATGTSDPHLRALKNALERSLEEMKLKHVRVDFEPESGWAVVDGFDFIVHLFLGDKREMYSLETLWKDAEVVDIGELEG